MERVEASGAATVAPWSPEIIVSPQVADRSGIARFVERVRSGYVAPAIAFQSREGIIIGGRHFAALARDGGLLTDSIHTLGPHAWHQLFVGIQRSRIFPAGETAPLLCGNSGLASYYHWTMETVATALMHRRAGLDPARLIVPALGYGWQRAALDLAGIAAPLVEVGPDELAVFDEAMTCALMGRSAGLSPHPAVLAAFAGAVRRSGTATKLYLSRLDTPDRRPMENEPELCDLLRAHEFAIVGAGALSVPEQAALVRGAELVVAPHGAALTNLVYAADGSAGPGVVELVHDAYLNPVFAKIGQAKRLDYRILVSPSAGPEHHHRAAWRCDLAALEAVLASSRG